MDDSLCKILADTVCDLEEIDAWEEGRMSSLSRGSLLAIIQRLSSLSEGIEASLKGNIVIPAPFHNDAGELVEWIPWDNA